jgi:argininosuccinate lyase
VRKLWGGRFEGATDELIERLNNSISFDCRMWRQDIRGSIAHADMLGTCGIVTREEADTLMAGLAALEKDIDSGTQQLPMDAEDVHTAVEGLLRERLGAVAGKLHTGRSRNDQVATDVRLYLRDAIDGIQEELVGLQSALLDLSEQHFDTILPGCTHLQHAQPVVLAHHLLAYFWMLDRDRERLIDLRHRVNRSPLGAGALAGTGFPIDREQTAAALGFEAVLQNSMDAVADRDFAVEFMAFASILSMHVSRLAEEIIIWNTPEYRYVTLDDAVTTGSSIMPQKKNPDVAELARGKTGRVFGGLTALLTLMKGLPLAYNKDMQEDKEPLFDAIDTLGLLLPAMKKTISTATFNPARMVQALRGDFSTATDLADHLVRVGYTFRDAHDIVGQIVRSCIEQGIGLEDLTPETLVACEPRLASSAAEAVQALTIESSVASRTSLGGTSPTAVRAQWVKAKARLASN